QNQLGNEAPMSKKDKMVLLERITMIHEKTDTVINVDSTIIDGVVKYDTAYDYPTGHDSWSSSSVSYSFLDKYMRNVDGAKKQSVLSPNHTFDVFLNKNKLNFSAVYSDEVYWEIVDFEFLSGRPFRKQEVDNQIPVAVITNKTAKAYFGGNIDPVGKEIKLDGKNFEVIGMVNSAETNHVLVKSDVFLPLTHANPTSLSSEEYMGPFYSVFLGDSKSDVKRIKDDINKKATLVPLPNPDDYNKLWVIPMSYVENYARDFLYYEDPKDSVRVVFGVVGGLLILFLLLPTLNLVNINISRILERSSEIGVRKAFGAHSGNILFQFVFENVILTFLGGVIGFFLALALIYIINDTSILGETKLMFNGWVFFYSIIICLFFGVISGIIPAYRMSRIHISNALKQNQV
ncbi:MAG: FtsX-like permease family protein, partial [Bacteroidota bacterium]